MDENERHGLAHAAETWRELAAPHEQVALVKVCDVAVRRPRREMEAMRDAATIMVMSLLIEHGMDGETAGLMVRGAMREACVRAGLEDRS